MSAVQLHVTLAATTEEDKIIKLHTTNKKELSLHRLMWFRLRRAAKMCKNHLINRKNKISDVLGIEVGGAKHDGGRGAQESTGGLPLSGG